MRSPPGTWASPRLIARRSAAWSPAAPTVVAEALRLVPDALRATLVAGPPASARAVGHALVESLRIEEAPDPPPAWLFNAQLGSFQRVVAALRRYRGALLADPVGSGKSWIALAAARALEPRLPALCLVPAALRTHWREVAARAGVGVVIHSHEQVSRGLLPGERGGLVIVDESHHYRNPHTQRYRHLAPWLVGRCVLLASATPVINRLADLRYQLLLAIRDDALVGWGVASIARQLEEGGAHPAFGQVIVSRPPCSRQVPTSREQRLAPSAEDGALPLVLESLDALKLSRHPPLAGLLRGVFWRALASSPTALEGALLRYSRLLLHAADARAAGHPLERARLMAFTRSAGEQLVLWEMLDPPPGQEDVTCEDLPAVLRLRELSRELSAQDDDKCRRLRDLLAGGARTLIFVSARETVRYLRDRLDDPRLAWCTGEAAGIGRARSTRESVLRWFRPDAVSERAPRHLVTTDVTAEGLDLHAAARVVHYDLAWTPTRLEQRDGRVLRLGSPHAAVELIRFEPPPALEARLRQLQCLVRKGRLPPAAGLTDVGRSLWRWRSELADRTQGGPSVQGVARVESGEPGALAAFELLAPGPEVVARVVGWLRADGGWDETAGAVEPRLERALGSVLILAVEPEMASRALDRLAPIISTRLRALAGQRWTAPLHTPQTRRLLRRLRTLAREAARRRDGALLTRLELALRFVGGGHTAGEAALVAQLDRAPDAVLLARLRQLPPPTPRADRLVPRLTGLILFGNAQDDSAHPSF